MSKKNRNIFGRIKQSFSKISNTLKKPLQATKVVEDVGSKIENASKNKITSVFKDLFTFKGSEQITQIENTVNNVQSAIKDPTGYATEYIKHKILNKLLTVATDALSAVVSKFSSTAGEVVKKQVMQSQKS